MKKTKGKELLKLISINFFLLATFIIGPAILKQIYKEIRTAIAVSREKKIREIDPRSLYPTYEDKTFSKKLFQEMSNLKTEYRPFIVSRHKLAEYKYTNIVGKYNTRLSLGDSIKDSTWFFGGSTMWGVGVSDSQTIPSIYNKLTAEKVINFGELGWSSRESLNQLISVIGDGYKPNKIVFYDGVNDVAYQCRTKIKNIPSHSSEPNIKLAFDKLYSGGNIKSFLLDPYNSILRRAKLIKNNEFNKKYNCFENPVKSKNIAAHLVNNWYSAYLISRESGSSFYGILQPTIFSSSVKYDYFSDEQKSNVKKLKKQFDYVYPFIISEMKNKCLIDPKFCNSLIDASLWLENKENLFTSYCHVIDKGNEMIVKRIIVETK